MLLAQAKANKEEAQMQPSKPQPQPPPPPLQKVDAQLPEQSPEAPEPYSSSPRDRLAAVSHQNKAATVYSVVVLLCL